MAIDIGDAVLTFLGDTTKLDQTFDKVGTEVPAKMAPVEAAFKGTSDAVTEMTGQMVVGQSGAKQLGEVMNLAGETSRESMYQARGEAGLLGEAFGIHLPRHVRSFIAELPGVGTALSAAFQATAVLFVIDALIKGIEKIQAWSEQGEKIAEAWHRYDQTIFESSEHMQKEIDRQEQKLIEMTQGPVAGLEFALKHLQSTAFETFSLISKDVDTALKAMREQAGFGNVFGDAAKDLDKFKDTLETVMRLAAQKHPDDPLAAYKAGIAEVQQKERDLTALILQRTAASGKDASAAVDGLHAERQAVNEMLPLLQQGVKLEDDRSKAIKQNIADEKASQDSGEAKRALDARLAGIEQEKAAQHLLYAEGKIGSEQWAAVQVKSANDAAAAQTKYRELIIAIDQKAGESLKTRIAGEELSTEKIKEQNKLIEAAAAAIDKAKDAARKFNEEWGVGGLKDMESQAKAAKEAATAFKELETSEKALAAAQKTLAEAEVTQDFKQQEAAIKELSNLRVISKQREAVLLAQLNQREEQDSLKILTTQLASEERILNAAKAKFQNASANPLDFTDAQLAQLKTHLDQAQAAWDKTQTQIIKQQSVSNDRVLSLDKSFYNQVLALAIAAGDKLLAENLKENHAQLLSAQANLADAKARGLDTKALEAQIKSLQKHQAALLKDAAATLHMTTAGGALLKSKPSWDSFFSDLVSGSLRAGEAVKEMGQMTAEGIGASVAAAVSGSSSFGAAMQKMAKDAIAALAEHAVVKALEELAYGFSDLANPFMSWHAPLHFMAAAKWGAIGGGAAALGAAIPGGSGSSGAGSASAGSGTPPPAAGSPAATAGGVPVSTLNVPRLSGGLVMQPTVAVVGGAGGGGSAMKQIAAALASHGSSGGDIHIKIETDLLSSARVISNNVKTGRVRMTSSNTLSPRGRRS